MQADRELIEASRSGDRSAFARLIERHQRAVYAVAFSATRDRSLADDVTQDAFVTAWRRLAVTLPLTVAGVCTFWAMPNLLVLDGVIFLCGMTIAPSLIAGYSLLEATARPGRATEAMSWLSTGISVGVACGSTAVGFVLDGLGPRWGYAFAAACGVTAALIYLAGLRTVSTAAAPVGHFPPKRTRGHR